MEDGLQVIKESEEEPNPLFHAGRARAANHDGPIGLNEVAKCQKERQQGSADKNHPSGQRKHDKRERLNDVTYADVRLLALRGTKDWDSIAAEYNRLSEKSLKVVTVRKRAKRVEHGLEDADVPTELIESLQANEEGAFEAVNRVIYGADWFPAKTQHKKPKVVGQNHNKRQERVEVKRPRAKTPTKLLRDTDAPARVIPREAQRSQALNQPMVEGFDVSATPQPRPTQGGKILGPELWKLYVEGQGEMLAEGDEEERHERELSPLSPEDYCHFAYQPGRRACRYVDYEGTEELEDLREVLEQQEWVAIGEAEEILEQANHTASKEVVRVPRGQEPILDATGEYTTSRTIDGVTGMPVHELTSSRGIVQVRVFRYLRTFAERVVPEMTHAWLSKIVYTVKSLIRQEPVRKESEDGVSGERTVSVEEKTSGVFTSIEVANHRAIERLVDLTVKPKTANLTARGVEITEAKQILLQQMENYSQEDVPFDRSRKSGQGVEVKVWVTEEKLQGPRNI